MADQSIPTILEPRQPASSYLDPIPGIIPFGGICTLAGATGVGKTALTACWVARWLEGKTICGKPTNRPTEIGVIAGDRSWSSHRQWFDAAGCPELKHYSLRDDPAFAWTELQRGHTAGKLKDVINRSLDQVGLEPGGLLVIDPLPIFLPGKVNDYKDMAIGLGILDQLIKPRKLTPLGLFHQSKQMNDRGKQYKRPQDRILGSAAQIGFSDTAMYLLGPEDVEAPYYGFGWIPHNAPAETFKFARDAWGLFVPYNDADDHNLAEQIFELLPPASAEVGMAAKIVITACEIHFGISRATAKRYLQRLMEEGRIEQPKRGYYRRKKPS